MESLLVKPMPETNQMKSLWRWPEAYPPYSPHPQTFSYCILVIWSTSSITNSSPKCPKNVYPFNYSSQTYDKSFSPIKPSRSQKIWTQSSTIDRPHYNTTKVIHCLPTKLANATQDQNTVASLPKINTSENFPPNHCPNVKETLHGVFTF